MSNDYAPSELEHGGAEAHVARLSVRSRINQDAPVIERLVPRMADLGVSVQAQPRATAAGIRLEPDERAHCLRAATFNDGLVDGRAQRDRGGPLPRSAECTEYWQGYRAGWNERDREIERAAVGQTEAERRLREAFSEEFVAQFGGGADQPPLEAIGESPGWNNLIANIPLGYEPLASVLAEAFQQSAHGKGKDRHANGKPFLDQPIMEIGRMVGAGYPAGQVMKKAQEAITMVSRGQGDRAVAELLGAIVYCAAAVVLVREAGRP